MYRLGFDIGGTFTDFVLLDDTTGTFHVHKVLTSYPDPSVAALSGLMELAARAGVRIDQLDVLIHGTTLVTNAIIERRGARLGLLTTAGFRDILEMGKEQRYDVYDLFLQFPAPLVPRDLRLEVNERVMADGSVLKPLNADEVRAAVQQLVDHDVESVAVALLHAYRNPDHERQVRDLIRREFPHLYVSISSDVVPEIREYERACTTAANAYVLPLMDRYVTRLSEAMAAAGFRGRFYLMQSSGGSASSEMARAYPIRLLESGPAAGALVTAFFGQLIGRADLVSFDMGGTTAKAALIEGGRPTVAPMLEAGRVHRFKRGSGLPIKAPVIDLIEIGAGGGSIARVSDLGTLQVGPDSAAADPGPACYGRGGEQPTVTDANLLLGFLNPDFFLGGRMTLDVDAARRALMRLAEPLGLTAIQAAWGVHTVVTENMANAARVHIVEKGHDPRRFAMMAFGGAGPLHACHLARTLGMREVVVPQAAGAASALGFLVAPIAFDMVRSYPTLLDEVDWDELNALYDDLESRARVLLEEADVPHHAITVTRTAEMRLAGQVHDITVSVPGTRLSATDLPTMEQAFIAEYRRLFSHIYEGNRVQVLNWRLAAAGPAPTVNLLFSEEGTSDVEAALKGSRPVFYPEVGDFVVTPVYDRYRLGPGANIVGPAVIEERESTTIIAPGDRLAVDSYRNLVIRIAAPAKEVSTHDAALRA